MTDEPLRGELVPSLVSREALYDDPPSLLSRSVPELRALAVEVGTTAGGLIRQVKRAAGLICWAMRRKMTEQAYGVWVHEFADQLGVSGRTLRDWREAAEKELAVSPVHTRKPAEPAGQKGRSEARKEISATTEEAPRTTADAVGTGSGGGGGRKRGSGVGAAEDTSSPPRRTAPALPPPVRTCLPSWSLNRGWSCPTTRQLRMCCGW